MSSRRSLVIAGAVAAVLAAGGGVAYAADSGGSSTAGTPKASHHADGQHSGQHGKQDRRTLLRHVVHGQFTVKTKDGYRTVLVQRGTITSDSATSVTVASADKYSHTYKVGTDTVVRLDKQKSSVDKLKKGEKVLVTTGPKTGADTARLIVGTTK